MKRYSVQSAHGGIRVNTVEDSHGPFVKYDDVAQLLSDVRALQAECEKWRWYDKKQQRQLPAGIAKEMFATDASGALARWRESDAKPL